MPNSNGLTRWQKRIAIIVGIMTLIIPLVGGALWGLDTRYVRHEMMNETMAEVRQMLACALWPEDYPSCAQDLRRQLLQQGRIR